MHLLLERGAKANVLDNEGTTVLHLASPRWREAVRLLLEGGVNPNSRGNEG